jgi:hypothetical protein
MFIKENFRSCLVLVAGLALTAGAVETAEAAESCDIEDVCEAVEEHREDEKSLDESMNLIVEQCKQPLSGSSCPLDQVVNHCWEKLIGKLEKCQSENKE